MIPSNFMPTKYSKTPKEGTQAYANFICDHFLSMIEGLKEHMGNENFVDHCAFAVGAIYTAKNKQPAGIIVNARGNVWISIRMLADLIDLAAVNIMTNTKDVEVTYEAAMQEVFKRIQHELLNVQRKPIP